MDLGRTDGTAPALMRVLAGERLWPPPIWMMRQAGRYLPEYRKVRAEAGSFLDLCYSPDLATEVTLQPIRRYGFDAAILFSDILVIPDALGQQLSFKEGEGPQLGPLDLDALERVDEAQLLNHLAPVFQAVRQIRAALPAGTALIGFCGAPWTVATYMIAGHGTSDQAPARRYALRHPDRMRRLLGLLERMSIAYLSAQIAAGADCVQIFDTWAGVLDEAAVADFVTAPLARIVAGVRQRHPGVPIIGFPKGVGGRLQALVEASGVDAIGLDWTVGAGEARALQRHVAVQGNLDPMRVIAGGAALEEGVDRVLAALGSGRLIFNLGHGITPDADPGEVARMVDRVRAARDGHGG